MTLEEHKNSRKPSTEALRRKPSTERGPTLEDMLNRHQEKFKI